MRQDEEVMVLEKVQVQDHLTEVSEVSQDEEVAMAAAMAAAMAVTKVDEMDHPGGKLMADLSANLYQEEAGIYNG